MKDIHINLFRSSSFLSQERIYLLKKLRLFSILLLSTMILFAILIGFLYLLGNIYLDRLEQQRSSLSKLIGLQARKQLLLTLLHDRLPIIQRTLDSRSSFEGIFVLLQEIFLPQNVKSIVMSSETKTLMITVQTTSFDDVQSMVTRIIKKAEEKKIYSPIINSLNIDRDGNIEAIFSFRPIF